MLYQLFCFLRVIVVRICSRISTTQSSAFYCFFPFVNLNRLSSLVGVVCFFLFEIFLFIAVRCRVCFILVYFLIILVDFKVSIL